MAVKLIDPRTAGRIKKPEDSPLTNPSLPRTPSLPRPLEGLQTPAEFLAEARRLEGALSAAEVVSGAQRANVATLEASTTLSTQPTLLERCKADFRVFLTVVWRHLLGNDPNPIQLDMAYWLQHGPQRAIIMAFRGFSKSWITGAYALWRLLRNPNEKIIVVSGSLMRAVATTNWCLQLIMTLPVLAELKPKANYRQSSQMFDVGNCIPQQSASFMAMGIGGQLVGFRGSLIIPDDVETQTNSLTVVMREKTREAVKEFESVLMTVYDPYLKADKEGEIKYLGTPHDADSLYLHLLRLKGDDGVPVYQCRVWTGLFPSRAQIKTYGDRLAPYILYQLKKHGDALVGHSTMPMRFPDTDLAKRRAAMGNSEFQLQFMLDLSGTFVDKYPLKLKDLSVMDLDDHSGPEEVAWGTSEPDRDLPVMGFDGDFFYRPAFLGKDRSKYSSTIGYLDGSGRGEDETALAIVAELYGRLYWLHLWANKDGYSPPTLQAIAQACVRFRVGILYVESNQGDGMLLALLRPVLNAAWREHNKTALKRGQEEGGTKLEEVRVSTVSKEKRILSVMEPITQSHRLVVNRAVIQWDEGSIRNMEGEDTRHRYAWGYQYTHLTKERDSLGHDDRLDALAGACGIFAPRLGVDPLGMAVTAREDRYEEELMKLLDDDDIAVERFQPARTGPERPIPMQPQRRH